MIQAKDIHFQYGKRKVLDGISLTLNSGELVTLLGRNGEGKTTLFRILAGELKPEGGNVTYNGIDVSTLSWRELARIRSVLPQESAISFPLRVKEVVELGRLPHKRDRCKDQEFANQSMALADIIHLENRYYSELSGGEKKRVQLARVLCQLQNESDEIQNRTLQTKKALFLDEPVNALDIFLQHKIMKILRHLADVGYLVFCILHDWNLAGLYSDRVMVLEGGKMREEGSPRGVLCRDILQNIFHVEANVFFHGTNRVGGYTESTVPERSSYIQEGEMIAETNQTTELREKWKQLKSENPRLRIKDCADILGVSELELLLLNRAAENSSVYPLDSEGPEILARAKDLGYVMALTRNDSCVHERKGIYGDLSLEGKMGLIVGEAIDLRIFFTNWKYSIAVVEMNPSSDTRRSLQFFDRFGRAVHKIHLNEKSNIDAFHRILQDFQWKKDRDLEPIEKKASVSSPKRSETISVSQDFLKEWAALKDTHDFFALLRKHKITRAESMEIAEGRFTRKLVPSDVGKMLELASASEVPIMVFVYNPGMVQIHTGVVSNIQRIGPWLNVLDSEFNLHLREDHIANVWCVNKPTLDGDVHSVEVYDASDQLIVQFFGKRKPGMPEREDWKLLIQSLV